MSANHPESHVGYPASTVPARHAGRFLLMAMLCLAAIGCDSTSFIQRTATLPVRPPKPLVGAAIRAVPEVQSVDYTEVPARSYWSLSTGEVHDAAYDKFTYRNSDSSGDVEILQNAKGEWLLRLTRVWLNYRPSPQEVRKTISLMDRVYDGLYHRLPEMPKATPAQLTGHNVPEN